MEGKNYVLHSSSCSSVHCPRAVRPPSPNPRNLNTRSFSFHGMSNSCSYSSSLNCSFDEAAEACQEIQSILLRSIQRKSRDQVDLTRSMPSLSVLRGMNPREPGVKNGKRLIAQFSRQDATQRAYGRTMSKDIGNGIGLQSRKFNSRSQEFISSSLGFESDDDSEDSESSDNDSEKLTKRFQFAVELPSVQDLDAQDRDEMFSDENNSQEIDEEEEEPELDHRIHDSIDPLLLVTPSFAIAQNIAFPSDNDMVVGRPADSVHADGKDGRYLERYDYPDVTATEDIIAMDTMDGITIARSEALDFPARKPGSVGFSRYQDSPSSSPDCAITPPNRASNPMINNSPFCHFNPTVSAERENISLLTSNSPSSPSVDWLRRYHLKELEEFRSTLDKSLTVTST